MNIFRRLFGTRESRDMKRLFDETRANVKSTYGPILNVGQAIVLAMDSTQQDLAPVLGISSQSVPSEQQIELCYELLYFYSHLTLRHAVAGGLSEPQISKLQGYFIPHVAFVAVNAFFSQQPEDKKKKIESSFISDLNSAEIEYSQCNAVWSEEAPFNPTTIFGRLAKTVATLWNRPSDLILMTSVTFATMKAYRTMQLDNKIKEVASVINLVDEGRSEMWGSIE